MAGKVVDVTLRLIDKITSPLNSIGGKISESANQWNRASKSIGKAGKNISNVGSTMTKKLTVPIVATGTACVKLASDFEAGMSKVQSISGATSKEMIKLSEKAKEMGKKTKFSATESADAFSYMAMAGWKTKDMLDGIEGVMYLAGATGEDLALTSDIVTDALTAFGMKANETNKFVDILATTASNANTDVAKMGETFQYVAPVAGSLGYKVEDVSVAIGLMANSGIKASNAGTALRSWLTNMAKPTKQSSAAMEALGLSLTDSHGKMKSFDVLMKEIRQSFSKLTDAQKAEYAAMLAGKTGMSGLLAVVNSSDSDFDKLTKSIEKSNGACKKMYYTANKNLKGKLTVLKSTVESLAISFGERLTPYVAKVSDYAQKLADKFDGLSNKQKDIVVKTALVVAAIGPAVLIFGKAVGTVGKVISVVSKVGKAFKTFGTISAMIASPVGITIAVLGALVVAGVLVYKNWDKIKKFGKSTFGYIKSVFKSVGISGSSMSKKLGGVGKKFNQIKNKALELWKIVSPVFQNIAGLATTVFKIQLGYVIGVATGLFSNMIKTVTSWFDGFTTALGGVIDFLTGVFTGNWKKAWLGVKEIFSGIFKSFAALAKAPINAVISVINGAIAGINKLGIKIPDWVPKLGGKDFSINIPKIPTLSVGTNNWKGGIVQISEKGGEIVDLPSGSRVYPHDKSVQKAYADGSKKGRGSTITIAKLADTIIVREEADIDKIATKLANKLEKTADNMGGEDIGYVY